MLKDGFNQSIQLINYLMVVTLAVN